MRINDTSLDFQVCLEKINHIKRQRRFYLLGVMRTLFGEWCLVREWGRIGAAGGQSKRTYFASRADCEAELQKIKSTKARRGYATIPIQLELFWDHG
jgi:predicted DNA-binding WGR domain protein